MNKTTNNKAGIIGILNKARNFNSEIGNYEEHFLNEKFNYTVRLSNGRITVPRTMAEDYEVQQISVSKERIILVAEEFISNKPNIK